MDPSLLYDLFKLASKYCEKGAKLLESQEKLSKVNIPRVDQEAKPFKHQEEPERKKLREKKESSKDKPKKPKKETGYNLYFKEKLKEIKESGGKINIIECSKKYSKEWNELNQEAQDQYNNQAQEMNIILEAMNESTSALRKSSSSMSDVSDSGSDEPLPSKKAKTR